MPNTKVTRQKWKDHLYYSKKFYFIGILVSLAVASLIFSVTRYVPENEHAVHIELVDTYADTTKLDSDAAVLLQRGIEFDSSLEEVVFLSIPYSGDGTSDYEGSQVYSVQVYAGDNDIFIQNELLTQNMIKTGYCVPLETLEGFEAFNAKYGKYILWQEEPSEEDSSLSEEESEEEETGEEAFVPTHAYAVDMSSLLGFNQRGAYDVRGKYGVVTVTSKNQETSFHVLAQMFDLFAPKGE